MVEIKINNSLKGNELLWILISNFMIVSNWKGYFSKGFLSSERLIKKFNEDNFKDSTGFYIEDDKILYLLSINFKTYKIMFWE